MNEILQRAKKEIATIINLLFFVYEFKVGLESETCYDTL